MDKEKERELELMHKRGYLVVKDNELIQKAQFQLSAIQQKVICYVISMIKPEDTLLNKYTIQIKDFAELCGCDTKNVYREFKKLIDDLDAKSIWVQTPEKTFKFRWFSEAEYIEKKGQLVVTLNSNLQVYLLQLQNNFTQYELWNILALKSKWSIRLYELFKSYQYQNEKTFDFEELKEILGATTYKSYGDFKKRILDKATEEINTYTDIIVNYEIVQSGKQHKVSGIKFIINKKDTLDGYLSYRKTIEKINAKNKKNDIKGQMSFDFDGNIFEE